MSARGRRPCARRRVRRSWRRSRPGPAPSRCSARTARASAPRRALAGLLPPARAGSRWTAGRSTTPPPGRTSPPSDRRVGVVFQDRLLFPHLVRVRQRRVPAARPWSAPGRGPRAGGATARTARRPASAPDARPSALSGGEQQRVALARALIAEPRPAATGRAARRARRRRARRASRSLLRHVLAALRRASASSSRTTPSEALTLADRVVVLEEGRVTQAGTPEELPARPAQPLRRGARRHEPVPRPCDAAGARGRTARHRRTAARSSSPWPGARRRRGGRRSWPPPTWRSTCARRRARRATCCEGRVAEVAIDGGRARVRVDVPAPASSPRSRPGRSSGSAVHEGDRVWVSFKTVDSRSRRRDARRSGLPIQRDQPVRLPGEDNPSRDGRGVRPARRGPTGSAAPQPRPPVPGRAARACSSWPCSWPS